MATEIETPREVLVRAMDQLTEVEEEHGEGVRTYLIAVYAHQVRGKTIRGWASTDDPPFVTVALLREVADHIECGPDDGEEDNDAEG